MDEDAIVERVRRAHLSGLPMVRHSDSRFPTDQAEKLAASVGVSRTEWLRPTEAASRNGDPVRVSATNDFADSDIVQGALRDRWLLSAIAAVASTREQSGAADQHAAEADGSRHAGSQSLMERVIATPDEDILEVGVVSARLFLNGRWVDTTTDNRVLYQPTAVGPEAPSILTPAFGRARDPRECWLELLEKAYASGVGGFEAVDKGGELFAPYLLTEALVALTGGVGETVLLRSPSVLQLLEQDRQELLHRRAGEAGGPRRAPPLLATRRRVCGGLVTPAGPAVLSLNVKPQPASRLGGLWQRLRARFAEGAVMVMVIGGPDGLVQAAPEEEGAADEARSPTRGGTGPLASPGGGGGGLSPLHNMGGSLASLPPAAAGSSAANEGEEDDEGDAGEDDESDFGDEVDEEEAARRAEAAAGGGELDRNATGLGDDEEEDTAHAVGEGPLSGEESTARLDPASGLLIDHGYPVVHLAEPKRGLRLCKLRTPWTVKEQALGGGWSGDWSDDSDLWAEHPDVEASLAADPYADFRRGQPGYTWMVWEDLVQVASRIHIARLAPDVAASVNAAEGVWIRRACGPCSRPLLADLPESVLVGAKTPADSVRHATEAKQAVLAEMDRKARRGSKDAALAASAGAAGAGGQESKEADRVPSAAPAAAEPALRCLPPLPIEWVHRDGDAVFFRNPQFLLKPPPQPGPGEDVPPPPVALVSLLQHADHEDCLPCDVVVVKRPRSAHGRVWDLSLHDKVADVASSTEFADPVALDAAADGGAAVDPGPAFLGKHQRGAQSRTFLDIGQAAAGGGGSPVQREALLDGLVLDRDCSYVLVPHPRRGLLFPSAAFSLRVMASASCSLAQLPLADPVLVEGSWRRDDLTAGGAPYDLNGKWNPSFWSSPQVVIRGVVGGDDGFAPGTRGHLSGTLGASGPNSTSRTSALRQTRQTTSMARREAQPKPQVTLKLVLTRKAPPKRPSGAEEGVDPKHFVDLDGERADGLAGDRVGLVLTRAIPVGADAAGGPMEGAEMLPATGIKPQPGMATMGRSTAGKGLNGTTTMRAAASRGAGAAAAAVGDGDSFRRRIGLEAGEWVWSSDFHSARQATTCVRVPMEWLSGRGAGLLVHVCLASEGTEDAWQLEVFASKPVTAQAVEDDGDRFPGRWQLPRSAGGSHMDGRWFDNPAFEILPSRQVIDMCSEQAVDASGQPADREVACRLTLSRSAQAWAKRARKDGVGTMMGIYVMAVRSGAQLRDLSPREDAIVEPRFVPMHEVSTVVTLPWARVLESDLHVVVVCTTMSPGVEGQFMLQAAADNLDEFSSTLNLQRTLDPDTPPAFQLRPFVPAEEEGEGEKQ